MTYTICTFYFELDNIQTIKNNKNYCSKNYLDSFFKIKNRAQNLYVWIDEKYYNELKDYANDNTIIIKKNITELRLYKYKNKIIECLIDMNNKRNKNVYSSLFKQHCNFNSIAEYIILNNSKFDIIKEACDTNPYNSELFMWIDFGVFQHPSIIKNFPDNIKPKYTKNIKINYNISNNNISNYNINKFNKLSLLNDQSVEFVCTLFTINKFFYYNFYNEYCNYMDKLLEESLFSTEQGILTMFFYDNSLFNKYEIEKGIYQTIHKLLE